MLKDKAVIAKDDNFININLNMLNRHGVITGATGTGKTITVKVLLETLSSAGIPSVAIDVKGDLSGCVNMGSMNPSLEKRLNKLGIENFEFKKFPVRFWDVFGESGHPIRVTISDMGPSLLSRILDLSDAGEDILNIVFKIADEERLELIDLKDLKSMLNYIYNHTSELESLYGNISKISINTIIRKLIALECGNEFFGEPNLDIKDFIKVGEESRNGYINLIEVKKLIKYPTLYATFIVWLLGKFYDEMEEVGDLDKPKIALFIDEAHLVFDEMNDRIIKKITQIIKLIRSKGVSVFFISQLPNDIPDEILNQLGNRVAHSLKAYTPKELKAIKLVAQTFRANPSFDIADAILELGTGEALVSFIDEDGKPSITSKATILPPQSMMGEASIAEIKDIILNSVMESKYRRSVDNISAYEKLEQKEIKEKELEKNKKILEEERKKEEKNRIKTEIEISKGIRKMTNSALSSIGRQLGNAIMRGIFGQKK